MREPEVSERVLKDAKCVCKSICKAAKYVCGILFLSSSTEASSHMDLLCFSFDFWIC